MTGRWQKWMGAATLAALPFFPPAAGAQMFAPGSAQVLTLDQDRLFAETLMGQRLQGELDRSSQALAERNRQVSQSLRDEEQALTEQRKTLPTDEFRALADAFDKKVVRLREEQDARIGDLQRQQEDDRLSFQRRVLPILSELIRDSGAVAILDNRAVILSAESIDVTDRAIARINEVLGDGAEADEDTVAPAPVPGDPPLSPAPGSAPAPQQ